MRRQRLAPEYTGWFAGVPVHINQLGFATIASTAGEGPATFRILVLGDSVTFGHGSVCEHTYPYLLEQRLKAWRPTSTGRSGTPRCPDTTPARSWRTCSKSVRRSSPTSSSWGSSKTMSNDNFPVAEPGPVARRAQCARCVRVPARVLARTVRRVYLKLVWKVSASQQLPLDGSNTSPPRSSSRRTMGRCKIWRVSSSTPIERLTDEQMASVNCVDGPRLNPDLIGSIQRERGWHDWITAVRRFQQMSRDGAVPRRVFLEPAPLVCPERRTSSTTADRPTSTISSCKILLGRSAGGQHV